MRSRSQLVTSLGMLLLWQLPLPSCAAGDGLTTPAPDGVASGRAGSKEDFRRAASAAPVRTSGPQVKRAPLEQPVTAPAPAGLDGKTPLEGQSAFAAITAAEKEVTRRWRDTVLPKLGHPAAGAAPLGERMYAYLTKNPGGRGRNHTVISEEELGRIKRVLDDIRRKRLPGAPAPPGTLSLALEEAVELGLEKNLRLQITRLNEDALETEIARARAIFHPLVGASMTASRRKEVGIEKLNNDRIILDGRRISDTSIRTPTAFVSENIPTGASIAVESFFRRTDTAGGRPPREFLANYTVSIVQPLLRGGRIYVATRPIKDAEYDWRIAAAQLQADILTVMALTKAAYYNAILADLIIDVAQDALARDEALIEASNALFKARLVTKRDVYSAEIIRAQDTETLARAEGNRQLAQNALSDVLGVPIGTETQVRHEAIDFQPIPSDLETWIALANERRPEIMAADEAIKKSWLNVRVAENGLLPNVDLAAAYGRAQTGTSVGRALDFRGDEWTAGLLFSYPLGNVAARSLLSRARIEHARFETQLVQTKRLVELQVRTAEIRLRTSLERMKPLAVSVEQAEGKLEIAQARFALGQATNKDVTDAQEDIRDGESDLLRSIVDYDIGLAELEASIAGQI